MKKEQILELIKKCSSELPMNQNGFFPVAQLGTKLKENGFDYSDNKKIKLLEFLNQFNTEIEISTDELPSGHPSAKWIKAEITNSDNQELPIERPKIRNLDLDGWGIIWNSNAKLSKLKEIALYEEWNYGNQQDNNLPILENYLLFTFKRLNKEKGKIVSNEQYATFDTGLVNKRYDSIYAIFEKNSNYEKDKTKYHEWILLAFAPETDRYFGLILGNNFNPLPKRTNYFASADQMYYDTTQNQPTLSDDHIIIDNIERFPIEFLEQHLGTNFDIRHIFQLGKFDKEIEIKSIKEYLKKNDRIVMNMRNRLKDAIEVAVKRVEWNFKTAIPLYYEKVNTMSLLIPLALLEDSKVDIALVVTKMQAQGYRGMTILTLEQAYKSARLISRPDSDWLIAKEIKTE